MVAFFFSALERFSFFFFRVFSRKKKKGGETVERAFFRRRPFFPRGCWPCAPRASKGSGRGKRFGG